MILCERVDDASGIRLPLRPSVHALLQLGDSIFVLSENQPIVSYKLCYLHYREKYAEYGSFHSVEDASNQDSGSSNASFPFDRCLAR